MITRLRIGRRVLEWLARGETPMEQITWAPSPHFPPITVWLEILSPETVKVSEHSRREARRSDPDLIAFLDRLDAELASATIEFGDPPPSPAPSSRPKRRRLTFADLSAYDPEDGAGEEWKNK